MGCAAGKLRVIPAREPFSNLQVCVSCCAWAGLETSRTKIERIGTPDAALSGSDTTRLPKYEDYGPLFLTVSTRCWRSFNFRHYPALTVWVPMASSVGQTL